MDFIIIGAVSILGVVDVWLERATGRGIIARADDALTRRTERRTMGRFREGGR